MSGSVGYEGNDAVQHRAKSNLARSVSAYDGLHTKAAKEALLNAASTLLPLADYVDANFSPDDSNNSLQLDAVNNGTHINGYKGQK